MTAATLVRAAVEAGIRITIDGDNLVLSAPRQPDTRLVQDLKAAKAEVLLYLRHLVEWAEDDWNALYDERAGIMEFDGDLPRADVEARAVEEVRQLRMTMRASHV